jgi:hypothetical protein
VVVADVEAVERLAQRGDEPRVAVAEVEDAAVAVAVPVPAPVVGIAKPRPLALADDDLDPDRLQRPRLAAIDVGGERLLGLLAAGVRLLAGRCR